MHIVLLIVFFLIVIVVFGLSIIGFILRSIFGIGRHSSSQSRQAGSQRTTTGQQCYGQRNQSSTGYEERSYSENTSEKRHKKIFTPNDGEYVDFEEVKE